MKISMAIRCMLLISALTSVIQAQQRFELIVPGSNVASRAERTDQWLRITDQNGVETIYDRAARFDAADRSYLGYRSAAARQIIRWPTADRGAMQIANDTSPGVLTFRTSRMEIRPIAPPAAMGAAELDPRASYRLVSFLGDARGPAITLEADLVTTRDIADTDRQLWHFTLLGNNFFRIHSDAEGRHWSLARLADDSLGMLPTDNSLDQLWQLVPIAREPNCFAFINAATAVKPAAITLHPGGRITLNRCIWADAQLWRCLPVVGPLPPIFGDYRFVSREIRPNPEFSAAQIDFVNSHTKELWLAIVDRHQPNATLRLKIPPGETTTVSLERDPGGTLVEVYERVLPNGFVEREELVTTLPPSVRYDVSVYELLVQSVAIDRTVKGGKLEDVQYAPRSVGWFELAAGPALQNGVVDVYPIAKEQQNPGQVRRIDPSQWQPKVEVPDPVEALLKKYQKKR